jgi:hypothetical protein
MEKLTKDDYQNFEDLLTKAKTSHLEAKELFIRAVQEVNLVVNKVIELNPHDPDQPDQTGHGGIVTVATLTDENANPPQLCRSVMYLIYDGLAENLATESEISLEDRQKAYKDIAEFMVSLKSAEGKPLFETSIVNGLLDLNDLLTVFH